MQVPGDGGCCTGRLLLPLSSCSNGACHDSGCSVSVTGAVCCCLLCPGTEGTVLGVATAPGAGTCRRPVSYWQEGAVATGLFVLAWRLAPGVHLDAGGQQHARSLWCSFMVGTWWMAGQVFLLLDSLPGVGPAPSWHVTAWQLCIGWGVSEEVCCQQMVAVIPLAPGWECDCLGAGAFVSLD